MLLLICEIAHSWVNFKLPRNACEILFMTRGRNVSYSHSSKMVATSHSLQGSFFSKKGEEELQAIAL
jgi:hypothetical protein